MKQDTIDGAMRVAVADLQAYGADSAAVGPGATVNWDSIAARAVVSFLTACINSKPNWLVRQALRTARGYAVAWAKRRGVYVAEQG